MPKGNTGHAKRRYLLCYTYTFFTSITNHSYAQDRETARKKLYSEGWDRTSIVSLRYDCALLHLSRFKQINRYSKFIWFSIFLNYYYNDSITISRFHNY